MKSRYRWLLVFLALGPLFVARPALADCADPPQPEVDWRKCLFPSRDFSGADLSRARLKYGRFIRGIFVETNMTEADARRTKFMSANLQKVKFVKARLNGADFSNADLSGADLSDSDLTSTQFQKANLRGANFAGANMRGTQLREADLSGATWTDGKSVCAEGSLGQCRFKKASGDT